MADLGGECVYASDIDTDCRKTYERNYGIKPDGYIYKTPENKYMPYQRYIDYGWFIVNPLKDDRSYTEITSLGSLMLMESLERHN